MRLSILQALVNCAALSLHFENDNLSDQGLIKANRYEKFDNRLQTRNKDPTIIDLTQEARLDVGNLTQYVILQRHKLTAEKLEYVVKHEPQSVVLFRDTNTVLVPHRDILDMTKEQVRAFVNKRHLLTYEEVDISNCLGVEMSQMLIPATGCLKRGSETISPSLRSGQDLLAFRYSISIEYGGQGDLSFGAFAGLFNFSVALSVTKRLKAARTVSFAGVHTCDLVNSLLVRLFYSPGTVELRPRTRRMRYRLFDRAIDEDDWVAAEKIKLLVESVPQYYCATDRFMDLKCHETTGEYYDEVGNVYKSVFDDIAVELE